MWLEKINPIIKITIIGAFIVGAILLAGGIIVALKGKEANSHISILGQEVKTLSVGIGIAFIGAMLIFGVIKKTINTFENLALKVIETENVSNKSSQKIAPKNNFENISKHELDAYNAFEIGYSYLMIINEESRKSWQKVFIELCKHFNVGIELSETSVDKIEETIGKVGASIHASHGPTISSYVQFSYDAIGIMAKLTHGNKPSVDRFMESFENIRIPQELNDEFSTIWPQITPNLDGVNKMLAWLNKVRAHLKSRI